jgi:hypothetical protein
VIGYELYRHDPIKGHQLIGVLLERRKNLNRITKESVLNWGERIFLQKNLDLHEMFLLEVEINGETIRPL